MTTKICRQCAFHRYGDRCGHPKAEQKPYTDKITGRVSTQRNSTCYLMRNLDFLCDFEGYFWTPKPPKQSIIQRITSFWKRK